ncbi:MAG TPA: thiamine diphosphokinase [Candidatus Limnocylindria bacterium]|nr:thiamine diphosphokinase [Candidatus Limnocylindria bacterium]
MPDRRAVILADGAVPTRSQLDEAWPDWSAGIELVIAADGGARHALVLKLRIDRWVGDGDSIDPADLAALAATGVAIERVAAEKDESDAELALMTALGAGADSIVLLGALGGPRVDHAVANLGLLANPALGGRPAWLFDDQAARCSLLTAPEDHGPATRQLEGREGDLVSIIPIGQTAEGVTTAGLRFPLVGEPLVLGRTRGVSNVRTGPIATVTLESGRLLLIETPATVRP